MITTSLNIPIEIPSSTNLNLEELKRNLTDYARLLIKKSTCADSPQRRVRSFDELHPKVQELCGIVSLPEEDLDGELARAEYWREV